VTVAKVFRQSLNEQIDRIGDSLKVLVGAGAAALLISGLLTLVSGVSWGLTGVLAVMIGIAAVTLTYLAKHASPRADRLGVLGALALGPMLAAVVCAWLSYLIYLANPATYAVPAPLSVGRFVDYYVYVFLDLLPAIKVPQTLHLEPAIQPRSSMAGVPVLAFKVFVVWLFFDAARAWIKSRQASVT
jgi:hypothetical protein